MSDSDQENQCRICLDGTEVERELGRLIRPCLCKGSISYVHVNCLTKWRTVSLSDSSFFACPQCHYQYRFARTRILGLATNPVILGGLSGILFTFIVMMASFVTTFFMSAFEQPSNSWFYISPFEVAQDLVAAIFRVIKDGELSDIFAESAYQSPCAQMPIGPARPRSPPSILKRFIYRFLIGLPLVGAGSVVHMLLSLQMLAPVQFIARYRANRRNRNNSKDIAALIVIALLVVGTLRALYKVYQFTERLTKRALTRAEDAILEVN